MERDLCTSSGPTFCSKQGWSAKFSSLQEFCGTDLKCWPEGSSHLICLAKLVLIQPRMQWSATATRASADSCSASLLGPHILFLQNCYPDSQSPPWAVAWSYLLPSAGLNLFGFFFWTSWGFCFFVLEPAEVSLNGSPVHQQTECFLRFGKLHHLQTLYSFASCRLLNLFNTVGLCVNPKEWRRKNRPPKA